MQFKNEKLGKELGNRCLVSIYRVFTAGRITSRVFLKKVWNSVSADKRVRRAWCRSGGCTHSMGSAATKGSRVHGLGAESAHMGACRKMRLAYIFRLAILVLSTRALGLGRLQESQPGSQIYSSFIRETLKNLWCTYYILVYLLLSIYY